MDVRKQLWGLLRLVLPAVGFALTTIGVYLMSLQTGDVLEAHLWRLMPVYVMIVLGVLAMLFGVFWTIIHSMKSKMHRRGGAGEERRTQVFTVERPTSFPPSYEESQHRQPCADARAAFVVVVDGVETLMSLAPPLYTPDSSQAPDCTWSWEQPPRYSRVEVSCPDGREAEDAASVA